MFLLLSILALNSLAQGRRPITFDDLIAIKRIADAQISPDGRQIAYVVNLVSKEENRGKRSIWIVPTAGGEARQFITSEKNDDSPRWSRDGSRIAFLSSRAGAPQIFVASADGSNAKQVTKMPEGVSEFVWSPDGRTFAFSSDIFPECQSINCTAERAEAEGKSKVKAVVTDRLLFRHWDSFKRGKRSHLFVVSSDGGEPRDVTPGDFDVPPFSLGDPTAFDISPDGQEIAFARNTEKVEATSTNNDVFLVPVTGGDAKKITANNTGSDTTPRYSPDGRWIAYRSQARNGYEADRFRLMLYDRKAGTAKELSTGFDRWVGEILWASDSKRIFIVAEDRGRELIAFASIDGGVKPLIEKSSSSGLSVSSDSRTFAFTRSSIAVPAEVYTSSSDGRGITQLTKHNAQTLSQVHLSAAEDFEFTGARKMKVHGYIVKPPAFDPKKKYPMMLLIHGGPQGAWADSWGYRWNPQMWAARGYVTVLINPHGSTGYGQAFTEQISGDWGGAVYEDLMKGVDHMIATGYVRSRKARRGRRIVRRVYGELDTRPFEPFQGSHVACRCLQPDKHVRGYRRVVVS